VNYWPKRKAMYWWKHFSAAEVLEEFEQIRELNIEAVRIALLWEDFQPERYRVDVKQMNNLEKVLQIADDLKVRIVPALFTGFMSGYNWLPHWALEVTDANQTRFPIVSNETVVDRRVKPLFGDDRSILEAELLQARTLAGAFGQHPAILFWDLGNQLSNVDLPASEEQAAEWADRLVEAIKGVHSSALVSCGLAAEDLAQDRRLSPFTMAESNDFLCVMGYSTPPAWAKGPLDSDVDPFLNLVAESMSKKPVLFGSAGVCTAAPGQAGYYADLPARGGELHQYFSSEDEAARHYEEVLDKLWNAGSLGMFSWSYGEYADALFGAPPCNTQLHERSFGLVRADGSLKPAAEVVRAFAAERRPLRRAPDAKLFTGADSWYRELPHSLTERFAEYRA
ncbi:MAG: hypothetical protein JO247_14325, partial [Chloroflexi bacterium]|nr:hypothetical protein [Chloroflexota bacterium]